MSPTEERSRPFGRRSDLHRITIVHGDRVRAFHVDTRRLAVTAQALEARLAGRDWLLSEFSAADCMMGFNLEALFRFVPRADYPATAAWSARAQARPAYRRAAERGGASAIYTQDFYELPDG